MVSFILLMLQMVAADNSYWLELTAHNAKERTALVQQGYDIVSVEKDYVVILATEQDLERAEKSGLLKQAFKSKMSPYDFPDADQTFHTYKELESELYYLETKASEIASLHVVGQSVEGRDIYMMRLSAKLSSEKSDLPSALLMGGHHAREHVSVEMPLYLIEYIIDQYELKNPRIVSMLESTEVLIIPVVNPDGKMYDIKDAKYKSWRKNRAENENGTYGVDLNRNYDFRWGGPGSSFRPSASTYHGPSAFSEPETRAVKEVIEDNPNIKTLISYHTFSSLVLWPWGGVDEDIDDKKDLGVFETMGKTMGEMTGYRAMKSSGLYVASGDTCDWAYGEHGIFAFTFELDPKNFWDGGFYPGAQILDDVFEKNIEPALYLIEKAQDPYMVLEK